MSRLSLGNSHDSPSSSTSALPHSLPALRNPVQPNANAADASPLVTIHSLNLSLPHPPQSDPYIDALPYHLLLCEMPNVLRHSTRRAVKRRRRLVDEMQDAGLSNQRSINGEDPTAEEENELEYRLESIGAAVGANLAERCVKRHKTERTFRRVALKLTRPTLQTIARPPTTPNNTRRAQVPL